MKPSEAFKLAHSPHERQVHKGPPQSRSVIGCSQLLNASAQFFCQILSPWVIVAFQHPEVSVSGNS